MESLNIVDLIEKNPISKLSQTYNNKLLTKIKTNFTQMEQQMFISSFYCYLNYHPVNDFVIDLDNVWNWLGFNQKVKAKILLEKLFIKDIDYKNLLSLQGKQTSSEKKQGGHNKEIYMLNIRTFKLFCIRADTKKAKEIHEYFVKLEEILHEVIEEESIELKLQLEKKIKEQENQLKEKDEELEENKKMLSELENLKQNEDKPTIYIYNIDTRKENPELKIGYTLNVYKRIKPYRQVCKFGKIEFMSVVYSSNIRTIENYIHFLLEKFNVKDEVFQINIDEAIIIVNSVINMMNIVQIGNVSERQQKLKESGIVTNLSAPKKEIFTNTIGTQTDFDETEPLSTPLISSDNTLNNKFNEFIYKFCIVRDDVEVNCKDIIGQYRLWSKNTKKEITIAFKNYLDIKFKYCRLQKQDKNQVVNGYKGIKLREITYKKSLFSSDAETFLFESCIFSPGATILKSNIQEEYKLWKKKIEKPITNKEEEEIKLYLKDSEHVLYSTVWTSQGSGQGYYGLMLKYDKKDYKKPSTTSKKVYKIDAKTKELLNTWDTISKAAEESQMSNAKMSRSIKNKVIMNDYYYSTTL
jgi:hypothetical protein